MEVEFIFKWYDFWIGFFYDKKKHWLYFFYFPMCGIIFKFKKDIFSNSILLYLKHVRNHIKNINCRRSRNHENL